MMLEKSKLARHYNEEAENDCLHIRQTGDGFASLYTVFAKEDVISCERILTGSVLKSISYEAKKAEAVKIVTEETEYIIVICHQEVNSPTDLIGADGCKGFGNVIVFDKNEGTFGGTVLHW